MDWPGRADALAASISKEALHSEATKELESFSGSIALAVSGGSDSVTALLLVYAHFPLLRSRLSVLHFNHLLRGTESDRDARFAEEIARGLGLTFVVGYWDDRESEGSVSESATRNARHRFFDSFVLKNEGALIVTGHQRDDILETLMLRIARASTVSGLAAPRPVSRFSNGKSMVRPLLKLSKIELEDCLSAAGIPWRTDRSNENSVFDRNKLRNEVIPLWQQATQFDLGQAAAQVRQYLEEVDELIERQVELSDLPVDSVNPAALPTGLPCNAVLRRWLQKWISSQTGGKFPSPITLDNILVELSSGEDKKWSLGDGFIEWRRPFLSYDHAAAIKSENPMALSLSVGSRVELPTGAMLTCKKISCSPELYSDLLAGKFSEDSTVLIDSDTIEDNLIHVRNWSAGDRYRPLNAPGSRKLQDMYVDRKIRQEERKILPVVTTTDSSIIWSPGLPVNHLYQVNNETKEILQLTYTFLR